MHYRLEITVGFLILLLGSALATVGEADGDQRANIVLVSLDTLRADHLHLYGYERETSPSLDRIAAESVVFEMAIAQASATLPSHRSLFLSRYASAANNDMPMLAELLKIAGYDTAAFTGGGNVAAELGFGVGFDTYFEDRVRTGYGGKRNFERIMPKFEKWLAAPKTRPFFVFLHSYDIHTPYDAPAPYGEHFCGTCGGPIDPESTVLTLKKIRHLHQFSDFTGDVTAPDSERCRAVCLYDGGILYADSFMARLEELLQRSGQWERTMLIVLSDHGEEFWDHGSVLHGHTVYQELMHVPLIIRLPGGRHGGRRIAAPVALMDVVPTIFEELGLAAFSSHQGSSLLPLIRGQRRAATPIVGQIGPLRGFLLWPLKWIQNRDSGVIEKFNLKVDSAEQQDLGGDDAELITEQVRELEARIPGLGARPVMEVDSIVDDDALKEQLRALGYIE